MSDDLDFINYHWLIAIEMADTCGSPLSEHDQVDLTDLPERPKIIPFSSLGKGDTSRLIELLLSDVPITREFRDNLADLLKRNNIKRKRGGAGRQTPAYRMSRAEVTLNCAAEEFYALRQLQRMGVTQVDNRVLGPHADDAFDYAADSWRVTSGTLRNFVYGKRGASRRLRSRDASIPPRTRLRRS